MDLRTLAEMGEFLGGLGVIVSLVYLAVQIRGQTDSQRSDNYARSLERMATMQQLMARGGDLGMLFSRGVADPASLSPGQRIQLTWFLTEFFGGLEFMHYQLQHDRLPLELWTRWEDTLKWWLTFPGVRTWWHARPTPFTPSFTVCVERCLANGYVDERPGAFAAFVATGRPPLESGESDPGRT